MSAEIESIIDDLLSEEQNIFGVAIVNKSGSLITQTQNWNLTTDLDLINKLLGTQLALGQKGMSSITIQVLKYMIV